MPSWDDVVAIGRGLPEVEESTWYRTPSLEVRGKSFARLRTEAEGLLVLMCGLEEKEALLASGDPAFTTTPHYDGYGAVLVDLERVDPRSWASWWRRRGGGRPRRACAATGDPRTLGSSAPPGRAGWPCVVRRSAAGQHAQVGAGRNSLVLRRAGS